MSSAPDLRTRDAEMESRPMVVPSRKLLRPRHHRYIAFENRDVRAEIMRRDRNDGAGHRLLEKQRSCRWIVVNVIPGNLSPMRGEAASGDNRKSTSVTYGAATLH